MNMKGNKGNRCKRAEVSLGLAMERFIRIKQKGQKSEACSTVLLAIHLILHFVLFILFLNYFGLPSVEKYLDQDKGC